jgi:MFS family permease
MRRYLELVRLPGVRPLLLAAAVGRLPFGMNVLALILLLRAEGVSYAEVGIVTGASGLAIGAALPLLARLIDRLGQTRVLVATACVCLAAGIGLTAAALAGTGVLPLAALAVASGAATPPVSPALRTLWPRLAGPERLDAAFAFDALQLEVFFIAGPLIAAGIATAISPQVAFLTGVTMQAAGAIAFAAAPASRRWRPREDRSRDHAGALAVAGIRLLVLALAAAGLALGALEIALPAFAEQHGSRNDSGWLFALWGAGSLVGGIWYGAHRWRMAPSRRFLAVSTVLAISLCPLPLAGSLPVFAALLVVAGLGLAPSTAAAYSLIGALAPEDAMTEAYAWQIVGYVAGGAAGAWIGGLVVEQAGVAAALSCAPVAAAAGLLVAVAGRRSLSPARAD